MNNTVAPPPSTSKWADDLIPCAPDASNQRAHRERRDRWIENDPVAQRLIADMINGDYLDEDIAERLDGLAPVAACDARQWEPRGVLAVAAYDERRWDLGWFQCGDADGLQGELTWREQLAAVDAPVRPRWERKKLRAYLQDEYSLSKHVIHQVTKHLEPLISDPHRVALECLKAAKEMHLRQVHRKNGKRIQKEKRLLAEQTAAEDRQRALVKAAMQLHMPGRSQAEHAAINHVVDHLTLSIASAARDGIVLDLDLLGRAHTAHLDCRTTGELRSWCGVPFPDGIKSKALLAAELLKAVPTKTLKRVLRLWWNKDGTSCKDMPGFIERNARCLLDELKPRYDQAYPDSPPLTLRCVLQIVIDSQKRLRRSSGQLARDRKQKSRILLKERVENLYGGLCDICSKTRTTGVAQFHLHHRKHDGGGFHRRMTTERMRRFIVAYATEHDGAPPPDIQPLCAACHGKVSAKEAHAQAIAHQAVRPESLGIPVPACSSLEEVVTDFVTESVCIPVSAYSSLEEVVTISSQSHDFVTVTIGKTTSVVTTSPLVPITDGTH